jgi:hypothetical protein
MRFKSVARIFLSLTFAVAAVHLLHSATSGGHDDAVAGGAQEEVTGDVVTFKLEHCDCLR